MKIYIYGDPAVYPNYSHAVQQTNATPVHTTDLDLSADCQGLILAGGGDIDPARYGAVATCSRDIEPERDRAEMRLISRFMETGRPILGICRGMQMLNVALGGDLIQDIPQKAEHQYLPAIGDQTHGVTAMPGSFLHTLYGSRFSVNSAHHQAVLHKAPSLQVDATATDGVIEAISDPAHHIYGVQFHPERMAFAHQRPDTVDGRLLFAFFLAQCR